jgi:ketosteroid isomerase-like protein
MTQRNFMRLMAIPFMITLVLSAQSQPRAGQKQFQSGDAEIQATLEKLYAAWSDLDPAKAAPFYAKDADLVFFDVAPMKYNAWAGYAAGVPQAFAAYRSGKFTLNDDLRVHRKGNWAWATATWQAELAEKDGSKEHLEGRYSAVLEKRGEQWLVVHEHMSVPLGAPPTPQ